MTEKTREAWLMQAVEKLTEQVFEPAGHEVPAVRVSIGWPGGRGSKKNVVGQCFVTAVTADKVAQIFISPAVSKAYDAVETLAHELIHAIDDGESGHRGRFVTIAKSIGFTAPWKSTPAGDELKATVEGIVEEMEEYPHAAINLGDKPKTQKTYMLKVTSPYCGECDPGYLVRMTQKWIEEGLPMCPHGEPMEVEA